MPVYLPTAVIGNDRTLVTLGHSGEIMGWFYPSKDHAQNIHQCMPCVYAGAPQHGKLYWTWGDEWGRQQQYLEDSNVCVTTLTAAAIGVELTLTDVLLEDSPVLLRRVAVRNVATSRCLASVFHFGDWNLGGIRTGNAVRFVPEPRCVLQSHREVAVAVGGDALQTWQCGKAGEEWGNNARHDLTDGALSQQDLEIGDVNWAVGFMVDVHGCDTVERTLILALGDGSEAALANLQAAQWLDFAEQLDRTRQRGRQWLQPGLESLQKTGGAVPAELEAAYRRSLLCLPLLCGEEGVAVAAPEFDHEFISCGGYGYMWPRDGGEYISGLMDAGYSDFSTKLFDWCARHQDKEGLWHQRYFLNGEPGPNWCLPPDMLQIDQVGAVLWAYGKYMRYGGIKAKDVPVAHRDMVRNAADYLVSRLTEKGVHANAFDTWETFVGSFTYSNSAIYSALVLANEVLGEAKYNREACRVKAGVLEHFRHDDYLIRGFDAHGESDETVDSASLGAIEPFGLLDLNDDNDLRIAEGTLRAITERLEVDWEGGRAIRRFEGDAYVGGVPACVNTLWMARCCLAVAAVVRAQGRADYANELTDKAQLYLTTVLRRATPTGLLPELMQGPTGQRYWAAPHGWAMASFVSGVLMLARQLAERGN